MSSSIENTIDIRKTLQELENVENQVLRLLEIAQLSTAKLQDPDTVLSCDYDGLQGLSQEYVDTVLTVQKRLLEHGKLLIKPLHVSSVNVEMIWTEEMKDLEDSIHELVSKKLHHVVEEKKK